MASKGLTHLVVWYQLWGYWKLGVFVWLETLRSQARKSAVVLAMWLVSMHTFVIKCSEIRKCLITDPNFLDSFGKLPLTSCILRGQHAI